MPTQSMPTRLMRPLLIVVAALGLASCSIQVDDAARPIPERERGQFGVVAPGDVAAGSNRIFLLASGTGDQASRLRSVRRDVPNDPEAIFQSLIDGPNDSEREAGLVTVLPDGLELQTVRQAGRTLTISVNDVFNELTPDALRIAVAQLVATANEIESVENLRLQIDDENQVWPLGDGQNTDRRLTIYDYPGLVESSQPAYPAVPTANS